VAVLIGGRLEAKAAIFDFNGTITDDEALQGRIFSDLASERLGLGIDQDFYLTELSGRSDLDIARRLVLMAGRPASEAASIVDERVVRYRRAATDHLPVRPRALDLIRVLAARMPLAVVSGAVAAEIHFVLEAAGLSSCFVVVVSVEDVEVGKPDPAGFLLAFEQLRTTQHNLQPGEVVVFEDSAVGLAAAHAAGMRCVVAHTNQPGQVAEADLVVDALGPELADFTVHDLAGRVWPDQALTVNPIDLGITNRNYRISVAGSSYMLRLPGARTEVLGINREYEAEAARRAAELGIGPPVFGELAGVGTLITEFVPGSHASSEEFQRRLQPLMEAVMRFHRSPPIRGRFPIHRVVEWHARDAASLGVQPPELYESLLPRSHAIEAAFASHPQPETPCHNDLLPANVLFDGDRVWLLDFEYAGMNDRFFDLGNLSVNSQFTDESDELLLTVYFGGMTNARWARLQLMKLMSEFREGMWGVVQQAISTLVHVDFVQYADERLSSCLQLAESPSFDRWLDQAAATVD
jgi:HAD superfamily hydrolase (TIGR01509 family)